MNRPAADNTKAIDAFLAAKAEIDTMLERLTALSADHFGNDTADINWGHVGTLNHIRASLREIADSAFHEGAQREPFSMTERRAQCSAFHA
jgi:hypothetical protein